MGIEWFPWHHNIQSLLCPYMEIPALSIWHHCDVTVMCQGNHSVRRYPYGRMTGLTRTSCSEWFWYWTANYGRNNHFFCTYETSVYNNYCVLVRRLRATCDLAPKGQFLAIWPVMYIIPGSYPYSYGDPWYPYTVWRSMCCIWRYAMRPQTCLLSYSLYESPMMSMTSDVRHTIPFMPIHGDPCL